MKYIFLTVITITTLVFLYFIVFNINSNKIYNITSYDCSLEIEVFDESLAVPLVVLHTGEELKDLYIPSIGIEYIAEAGIPEVFMKQLDYQESVLHYYSIPGSIIGNNLMNKLDDDSPTKFIIPIPDPKGVANLTNEQVYISILGMIIESNDAIAIATSPFENGAVSEGFAFDAGTEENIDCLNEEEVYAISKGCPAFSVGSYDTVHNGTSTDEIIKLHKTFTKPTFAYKIYDECIFPYSQEDLSEPTISNEIKRFSFDELHQQIQSYVLEVETSQSAIFIFSDEAGTATPFDESITDLIKELFDNGDIEKFSNAVSNQYPQSHTKTTFINDSHTFNSDTSGFLSVWFVSTENSTIQHFEIPFPFVSRGDWTEIKPYSVVWDKNVEEFQYIFSENDLKEPSNRFYAIVEEVK